MTAQIPRLSGEDWQSWANRLLTCHYGPTNYQKVPDNDRGDAGIEGFTLAEGDAYQAYGCEGEPLRTLGRYEKQRNKMSEDIGKFIANRALLQKLFGAVGVTRWALFVPFYDSKEIVIHAANKITEVLKAQLPYVGRGFHVAIVHEEDFVIERDRLINAGTTNRMTAVSTDGRSSAAGPNRWPSRRLGKSSGRSTQSPSCPISKSAGNPQKPCGREVRVERKRVADALCPHEREAGGVHEAEVMVTVSIEDREGAPLQILTDEHALQAPRIVE